MSDAASTFYDTLIVGGGPAGASAAIWLKRLGLLPLLLEGTGRLGGLQAESPYPNPWVASSPGASGREVAAAIAQSVADAAVETRLTHRVAAAEAVPGGFAVRGSGPGGGFLFRGTLLVVASGVRRRRGGLADRPEILVGPGAHVLQHDFRGLRVALLGGGDNAFDHYGLLSGRGAADLHIHARSVRAQRRFVDAVPARDLSAGRYAVDDRALTVDGRPYDRLLVFYGYEPATEWAAGLGPAAAADGYLATDPATAETSVAGVYAIGELARRMHPSVVTAMADGVVAAKAIQARLRR